MMRRIISVLMENEAGALSRVVGLFAQRNYNIETLTVAPTEDATLSRLTLTTSATDTQVEQITKDGLREFIDATNEARSGTIDVVDLPPSFADLYEDQRVVMERDLARSFADEYARGKAQLSDVLRAMIERDASTGRVPVVCVYL